MDIATTPIADTRPATSSGSARTFAVPLVAAPLLILAGSALVPSALGTRHGTSKTKAAAVLADVAPVRSHIPASLVLLSLGLSVLVLAAVGIWQLTGRRRLALVGLVLVAIGAPAGAASNAVTGLVAYRLTAGDLSRSTAAQVLAWESGGSGLSLFGMYLLVLVGLICLAIASWRSGAVPWWVAALVGVGVLVSFGAPEGPAGLPWGLPFLAGMILLARSARRI